MKHCGGMIGDSIGAMMKQSPCKNKMCCGENRLLALRSIGALVNSPHRLDGMYRTPKYVGIIMLCMNRYLLIQSRYRHESSSLLPPASAL